MEFYLGREAEMAEAGMIRGRREERARITKLLREQAIEYGWSPNDIKMLNAIIRKIRRTAP